MTGYCMSLLAMILLPRIGGAEMLKLQEAIPPFSLMEDSTQGKRYETLVNVANSCRAHVPPVLALTIPIST